MRNNIMIFGSSRSGKTTLAMKINKRFNYNVIMVDTLVSAFEKGMPELNINHSNMDRETLLRLKPFLNSYIKSLNNYNNRQRDINYVIEGSYLDLEDYKSYDKFCKIVLVQELPTYMDYYNQLKEYDKDYDWTAQISDEELMEYAKNLKKDNDRIIAYCKENNIRYYDTSANRDTILETILNELNDNILLDKYKEDGKITCHYGSLNMVVEAKWFLLDSLKRRYNGIMEFDSRFATKDYTIKFVSEFTEDQTDVSKYFIEGLNLYVRFVIDNDLRECYVLLDPNYDKQTKKRIVHKMVKLVFLRLYQLKRAIFMHCACVEKDGRAVIISGNPMSGKTVTMLNLLNAGFSYITNDFLIIDYVDDKPNFLVASNYIGIRKTEEWLATPENKKYSELQTIDRIVVTGDYIMMSPNNLIELNNNQFGIKDAELKLFVFPSYIKNENFKTSLLSRTKTKERLDKQMLFNFLCYSNEPLEKEAQDLYKINVPVRDIIDNDILWDKLLSANSFTVIQNETTNEEYIKFIEENLK